MIRIEIGFRNNDCRWPVWLLNPVLRYQATALVRVYCIRTICRVFLFLYSEP